MKILLFFLMIIGTVTISAQEEPKVCISQAAANKCASVAAELIEARDVIANFQKERLTSQAERDKAAAVIAGLNELVTVKDRIIAATDQINALYKQVIEFQAEIIDKYEKKLMKGKSGFDKLLDALKTVVYFAAGIALGRGI